MSIITFFEWQNVITKKERIEINKPVLCKTDDGLIWQGEVIKILPDGIEVYIY